MSSWKKYGGINHFEQLTNINSTNLVVDHLSLRFPYEGIFSICGELIVSGDSFLDNDLTIQGNTYSDKNVFITEGLYVDGNTGLSANLNVRGNTYLYNPLYLLNNTGKGTMYFVGDTGGVSMNKQNPEAILDIYGSRPEILNVFSDQYYTTNILARNKLNYGITLTSDILSSNINFYHRDIPIHSSYDNGNGGGQIKYEPSGNMIINVPNNTKILSKMVISDRIDTLSETVDGEVVTIYDNPNGYFLLDIFNNSSIYNGNALSLISTDNNSITFFNIITPEQMGWKWGGGAFPNDSMRNMSTTGYIDENQKYVPSETIVSGNSLVKNRSTIGINTYSPKTELYIMDINGPVCIQHQEIHLIAKVDFEIISVSFSNQYPFYNYGIAIGKSNTIDNRYIFKYFYLLTNDGGKTWTEKQLIYTTSTIPEIVFKAFYYNPYNIVIASSLKFLFYVKDGINWNFISNSFPSTQPSIFVTTIQNVVRTFLAYPRAQDGFNNNPSIIWYFDDYLATTTQSLQTQNDIYCIAGYSNYLFGAGDGYIAVYDISVKISVKYETTNNYTYNSIYTLDGINTIAVGYDIISYTQNGGENWTNISNILVDFNDVYILDKYHAIAVGNHGMIYYTIDGYQTWNELSIEQINGMGNGNNIINQNTNITSVKMISNDTFILSCVTQSFNPIRKQTGSTNMFYLHFPDLFNLSNRTSLLDIYGNMSISGDININNSGKIQTTNDTFYLVNNNANTVYFAGDASNIYLGNSINGGITYVRHQLDVLDNTYLHNNVVVSGIQTIQNNTETTSLDNGALQIAGGMSVKKSVRIGGNVQIEGIINIKGGVDISGNIRLGSNPNRDILTVNAKSFFNNDVSMNNHLYVLGDISLNNSAHIQVNANIGNNLYVNQLADISYAIIQNNLLVNQNTFVQQSLIVNNDVSFNRNLSIGYDISTNRYLNVGNNAFFNRDIYVNNNEWVNGNVNIVGDISLNGNQSVGNNVTISGQLSVKGNTTIGNQETDILTINSLSVFNSNASMNGNLNIEGNTSTGSLLVSENTNLNRNLTVGTDKTSTFIVKSTSTFENPVTMTDISANNIISSRIYSTNVYSIGSELIIGNNATKITIGGPTSIINFYDMSKVLQGVTQTISSTTSRFITLNHEVTHDDIGNSGINISKNLNPYTAFFLVSSDQKQVKFKAPLSSNVVSINLYDLSTNLSTNNNGILVVKRYNEIDLTSPQNLSINHQISVSSFDISNILQRSMTESTLTKQVVTTNLSVKGNLIINSSITNTSSALDISGNFAHSNGWIMQDSSYYGLLQSGNRIKQTYMQGFLDISGNVIIRNTGNLTVGGNTNISGSVTCGNDIVPYYKYLFQATDIKQNYNIVQIIPTSDFFTSPDDKTITNNYGNLSFKNGTYKTSASSVFSTNAAYNAFNGSINNYWQSDTIYNSGIYSGTNKTVYNTTSISGDWLQIQLPSLDNKSIQLTSFSICCVFPNNAPNEFDLFGSSGITTWKLLYSNPSSTSTSNPYLLNSLQTYTVSTLELENQPYFNFRLVIKSIYNTSSPSQSVIINQLNLYGIPYYNSSTSSIYSNNIWLNYGSSSTYDLLDSSSVSISTTNTVPGLGNSLYINNVNYLSLPTILLNTTSFSVLFWIKINNNQTSTIYEFNSLTNLINLRYNNSTNTLILTINNTNYTITQFDISKWCHIGIIYFANYANIYINGIIFQTITLSYTPDNYVINYIGRSKGSSSPHNSNFYMSDFRTYLFSLNDFQINSIYNVTNVLTVNNSLSYHFKDTYFGSNINIYNDLSLNGNFNITSGNLFTGTSNTGNIFTTNTGIINIGTASSNIFVASSTGKTTIQNDVSMNKNVSINGNILINSDLSLNGNFNITSGNIFTGTSNTGNIFTTNTGIINIGTASSNIFVASSTGKTTIRNDISMNGNVSIHRDLSLNGNFNITSGNIFTGTSNTGNIFTTNTGIINIGTASSNIFVASSTGKTTIRNDISMNGNVSIHRDLSLNGNFYITSGNIFTGTSNAANIFTTNTGIVNIGTASSNVFIASSTGKTTIQNDTSMNGNVYINRELSLNGNFNITSGNIFTGTSNTGNIFTTNTGIINIGTASSNIFIASSTGKTTIRNDVSMNGNVFINRDLSLNGNCNINTNCNIIGNCIISSSGKLYTNNINAHLSTDTITFNNNINTNNNVISCGNINARTINAITFNATSDYRIKEDIKQITYNVDKLKPVQYINKESKKEDIGLIAHELQEICPFLVTGEKNGSEYQSINYIGLIGILIKEIQDLKKRVAILEEK